MKKYRAYCFDLDGTLYSGMKPIEEGLAFVRTLQSEGIEPYYITNNASVTAEDVQRKLAHFSIEAPLSHIYTSAVAAARYAKSKRPNDRYMLYGEDGLHRAFQAEGLLVTADNPDAVVMGLDRQGTYEKLADVALAIQNGATFIATNEDRLIPVERGLVPGNGAFVHLIEYATRVEPIRIGKPEPFMLQLIQEEGGYAKDEMVMIGDNYDTDIQFGIRFGIDTIHVDTGVTRTEEVAQMPKRPTYMVRSLQAFSEKTD